MNRNNNNRRGNRARNGNQGQRQNPPGQGTSRNARRRRNRPAAGRGNQQQNAPNRNRRRQNNGARPPLISQALQEVGSTVGGLVGMPGLGRLAGQTIGRIFGSGDYVLGGAPTYNTLSGNTPPSFGDVGGATRVRHREFIADISSSIDFVNRRYILQPCDAATFPWLSGIASKYDQYRFHGLVFEFKTTSGNALNSINTALGSVGMVTQYDPVDPAFVTKQAAENFMGAQSCSPASSMLHAVECAMNSNLLNRMYTRAMTNTTANTQLTDWGNLNVFTSGSQNINVIGELWVSYDVEFYKPTAGLDSVYMSYTRSNGSLTADGNLLTLTDANMIWGLNPFGITITSNVISLPTSFPRGRYMLDISGVRDNPGVPPNNFSWSTPTHTGGVNPVLLYNNHTYSAQWTASTTAIGDIFFNYAFEIVGSGPITINLGNIVVSNSSSWKMVLMLLPLSASAGLFTAVKPEQISLTSQEIKIARLLIEQYKDQSHDDVGSIESVEIVKAKPKSK